jgi:hypothetical protein
MFHLCFFGEIGKSVCFVSLILLIIELLINNRINRMMTGVKEMLISTSYMK